MELYESLEELDGPLKNAVVTIGNFDGVHKGHKALLKRSIEEADKKSGVSVAVTFDPHPIKVIKQNGEPPLITLKDQKIELITSCGIDVMIIIPFTIEFSKKSSREFIELMVEKIGMKTMIVGNDYSFGKNREGNIDSLKDYSKEFGFDLIIPKWIDISNNWNERVSSTKIRELVTEGKVSLVPELLDRHYQIRGKVVHGRNRGGKLLGFPTANINLHDELCPKTGVYAVTVEMDDIKYDGVANIGYSPTFDDHLFTVEAHILDLDMDLYGKNIKVNFIERLRDEVKFSSIEQLSYQIDKDIEKAREIFSRK